MKSNQAEFYRLEDRVLFEAGAVTQAAEAAAAENTNAEAVVAEAQEAGAEAENNSVVTDAELSEVALPPQTGDDAAADADGVFGFDGIADSAVEVQGDKVLVVINSSVADAGGIVNDLGENYEILYLQQGTDAMDAINDYLDAHADTEYSALHIVSHGKDGSFILNGETVDNDSLNPADWKAIGEHLSDDAEIMIYGCDTAKSDEGKALIQQIANLTGAEVAASTDATGVTGDWDLEYQTGLIDSALLAPEQYSHTLATEQTITVTTLADDASDGIYSLRGAVDAANAAGTDVTTHITFNLADTDTVTLTEELAVKANITIDGTNEATGNNITIKAETSFYDMLKQYKIDQGGSVDDITVDDITNFTKTGDRTFDYNGASTKEAVPVLWDDYVSKITQTRVFNIAAQKITLSISNATIEGGRLKLFKYNGENTSIANNKNGAVFWISSSNSGLKLDHVSVLGGYAENHGLIRANQSSNTVEITNSTLSYGYATSCSGAGEVNGTLVIENSEISHNKAGDQTGGLKAKGSSLTIKNALFDGNQAGSKNGGALEISANSAYIDGVTFINNRDGNNGSNIAGAVFIGGGKQVDILNSTFYNNTTASSVQGAVTLGSSVNGTNAENTVLNLINTSILQNPGSGSGLYVYEGTANVINSVIAGNKIDISVAVDGTVNAVHTAYGTAQNLSASMSLLASSDTNTSGVVLDDILAGDGSPMTVEKNGVQHTFFELNKEHAAVQNYVRVGEDATGEWLISYSDKSVSAADAEWLSLVSTGSLSDVTLKDIALTEDGKYAVYVDSNGTNWYFSAPKSVSSKADLAKLTASVSAVNPDVIEFSEDGTVKYLMLKTENPFLDTYVIANADELPKGAAVVYHKGGVYYEGKVAGGNWQCTWVDGNGKSQTDWGVPYVFFGPFVTVDDNTMVAVSTRTTGIAVTYNAGAFTDDDPSTNATWHYGNLISPDLSLGTFKAFDSTVKAGAVVTEVTTDQLGITRKNGIVGAAVGKESASLTVTTTADTVNEYDGETSLREAIGAYLADTTLGNTITFSSDVDWNSVGKTIELTGGELAIALSNTSLTIDGALSYNGTDQGIITIKTPVTYGEAASDDTLTASTHRVFTITGTGSAALENMIIQGGDVAGNGGAVSSAVKLTLDTVMVSDSRASGSGGGVFMAKGVALNVYNSTIMDNISTSTAFGVQTGGGGIGGVQGYSAILNNTTLIGNAAYANGSAINNYGSITLLNCTVTGNINYNDNGAVNMHASNMAVLNSIVTGNTGGDINLSHNNGGSKRLTVSSSVFGTLTAKNSGDVNVVTDSYTATAYQVFGDNQPRQLENGIYVMDIDPMGAASWGGKISDRFTYGNSSDASQSLYLGEDGRYRTPDGRLIAFSHHNDAAFGNTVYYFSEDGGVTWYSGANKHPLTEDGKSSNNYPTKTVWRNLCYITKDGFEQVNKDAGALNWNKVLISAEEYKALFASRLEDTDQAGNSRANAAGYIAIGAMSHDSTAERFTSTHVTDSGYAIDANDGVTTLNEALIAASHGTGTANITFESDMTITIRPQDAMTFAYGNINFNLSDGDYTAKNITLTVEKPGTDDAGTVQEDASAYRIMNLNNATVAMENITMIGGSSSGSNLAGYGGAIYVQDSSLTVTGGAFEHGSASSGGAIYVGGTSTLAIDGTEFRYNNGIAVYAGDTANVSISNALFEYNKGKNGSAVSQNSTGMLEITDSVFRGNQGSWPNGGTVYVAKGGAVIRRSLFDGNTATGGWYGIQGAALAMNGGKALVDSSIFINHKSDKGGIAGAIAVQGRSVLTIANSTIVQNGYGLFSNSTNATLTLINTLLGNNTASDFHISGAGPKAYLYSSITTGRVTAHSGSTDGAFVPDANSQTLGVTEFRALFAEDSIDGTKLKLNDSGVVGVDTNSAAVNSGVLVAADERYLLDDGTVNANFGAAYVRKADTTEWSQTRDDWALPADASVLTVYDTSFVGSERISSMNNGYIVGAVTPEAPSLIVTTANDAVNVYDGETSLREALAYATALNDGSTVTFSENVEWDADGDGKFAIVLDAALGELAITASMNIVNNTDCTITVKVPVTYAESAADETLTASDFRVLSISGAVTVDIDGGTGGFVFEGGKVVDASGGVISITGTDKNNQANVSLHHITAQHGAIEAPNTNSFGVGIFANHANLTIDGNSTIANNTAIGSAKNINGIGVYISGSGTLTMTDVIVSANKDINNKGTSGGGIYINSNTSAVLTNVEVSGNYTRNSGGLRMEGLSLSMDNCIIQKNSAQDYAGIYISRGNVSITDTVLTGNSGGSCGELYISGGNVSLKNVSFTGTSTTFRPVLWMNGASAVLTAENVSIFDCVSSKLEGGNGGSSIVSIGNGMATFINSTFTNNRTNFATSGADSRTNYRSIIGVSGGTLNLIDSTVVNFQQETARDGSLNGITVGGTAAGKFATLNLINSVVIGNGTVKASDTYTEASYDIFRCTLIAGEGSAAIAPVINAVNSVYGSYGEGASWASVASTANTLESANAGLYVNTVQVSGYTPGANGGTWEGDAAALFAGLSTNTFDKLNVTGPTVSDYVVNDKVTLKYLELAYNGKAASAGTLTGLGADGKTIYYVKDGKWFSLLNSVETDTGDTYSADAANYGLSADGARVFDKDITGATRLHPSISAGSHASVPVVSISFDMNSGSLTGTGAMNDLSVKPGNTATFTSDYALDTWTLLGFSTDQDATTADYVAVDGTYTLTEAQVDELLENSVDTLYAIWKKDYQVTYHEAGKDARTETFTVYNGNSEYTLTADDMKQADLADWNELGWSTAADSHTVVDLATLTISADSAFYAVYSRTVSIAYNSNGGTGTMPKTEALQYRTAETVTPVTLTAADNTFTKTDYMFTGWSLTQDGAALDGKTITVSGTDAAERTLYALWEENAVFDTPGLVVTTADDIVAEDGLISLREAIAFALANGGTVTFSKDVFTRGNMTVSVGSDTQTNGFSINKAVAIDGHVDLDNDGAVDEGEVITIDATGIRTLDANGAAIYGGQLNRLFNVNKAALTLTNLTLANTAGGRGGAISAMNGSTLTFDNLTLTKNITFWNNDTGGRGAIYIGNSTAVITDSTFTGNGKSNPISGGVFYIEGALSDVSISDSVFSGNSATWGAAISQTAGKVDIADCVFSSNAVANDWGEPSRGGAIYQSGGTMTITDSQFIGNSAAAGAGGAIALKNGTMSITDTSFTGTNIGGNGGAVYMESGAMTISGGTFTANKGNSNGGAVYLSGGELTISESSFEGNVAQKGGAVYLTGGNLILASSAFYNNEANTGGGAVYLSNGNLTVSGSSFEKHTAQSGGAIKQEAGTLSATDVLFTGNTTRNSTGGAAVHMIDGTAVYDSVVFTENSTGGCGAAIKQDAGECLVVNATVYKNSATWGGMLYLYGSKPTMTVINSTIVENYSTDSYPGIGIKNEGTGNKLYVLNCIVAGNKKNASETAVYSDVQGGMIMDYTTYGVNKTYSYGNMSSRIAGSNTVLTDTTASGALTEALGAVEKDGNLYKLTAAGKGAIGGTLVGKNADGKICYYNRTAGSATYGKWIDLDGNAVADFTTDAATNYGLGASAEIFDSSANGVSRTETLLAFNQGAYAIKAETPGTEVDTAEDIGNPFDGKISLRDAVAYAGTDGTITMDSSLTDGVTIDSDLTINGLTIDGLVVGASTGKLILNDTAIDSLTVNDAAVDMTGGTVAEDGALILNSGEKAAALDGVANNGTLTIQSGTVTADDLTNAGTANLSGDAMLDIQSASANAGTITVSDTASMNIGAENLLSNTGSISITASEGLTGSQTVFGGSVAYSGSAEQVIAAGTYSDLKLTGTGAKELDGKTVAAAALTASGVTIQNGTVSLAATTPAAPSTAFTGTTFSNVKSENLLFVDKSNTVGAGCTNIAIARANAAIEWSITQNSTAATDFTYNGSEFTVTAVLKVDNETLSLTELLDGTAASGATNAGNYTFTVEGLADDKSYVVLDNVYYVLTAGTKVEQALTIAQREITLQSGSNTWGYDGESHSETAVSLTAGSYVAGELLTYKDFASVKNVSDSGTANNTFTAADSDTALAGNYKITYVYGDLEITKRAVTLTAASAEKEYDGTALTDSTFTGTDGFVDGEGAAVTVTGSQTDAGESANVLTYTLNSGTLAENYDITVVDGKLTVTPRQITVTATDASKVYNGMTQTLDQAVMDRGVDGHTVTVTFADSASADAGEYSIAISDAVIKDASGRDVSANYNVTEYIAGKLTITKKVLTVTSDAITLTTPAQLEKIYDKTDVVNGGNPLDFTIASGVERDGDLALTGLGTYAGINAGAAADGYAVDVTISAIQFAAAQKNFELEIADPVVKTGKITPREITVTPKAETILEGETPALKYSVTSELDLVDGDKFTGTLGLPANANQILGDHEIILGTLAINDGNGGQNYILTLTKGVLLRVNSRPVHTDTLPGAQGQTSTPTGVVSGMPSSGTNGAPVFSSTEYQRPGAMGYIFAMEHNQALDAAAKQGDSLMVADERISLSDLLNRHKDLQVRPAGLDNLVEDGENYMEDAFGDEPFFGPVLEEDERFLIHSNDYIFSEVLGLDQITKSDVFKDELDQVLDEMMMV